MTHLRTIVVGTLLLWPIAAGAYMDAGGASYPDVDNGSVGTAGVLVGIFVALAALGYAIAEHKRQRKNAEDLRKILNQK